MGGVENLVEDCFRTALEMDGLATAVRIRIAAFHPPIIFQTIQQTGEGRAFDSHPLGDDLLGQLVSALREMDERPPFSLAETKRAQTLVEPGPPGARGAEEDEAEFVDIGRRHVQEKLVSVLTNRTFKGKSTRVCPPAPGSQYDCDNR